MAIGAPWVGTVVQGNVAGSSVTTVTVDVSGATTGEVVWIIGTLGDAELGAIATPAGWNLLGQTSEGTSGGSSSRTVIFWKVKQAGDTTVVISDATNWTVATKPQFVPISWPGVDTTTPAEGLTWLAHTTGTTYTTGTATPTAATRWAVGVFSARGSTAAVAWTPDAALTERVDAVNSATVFIGLEVADSNAAVTAAAHSYTATSQTASHGLGGLFYLIPATAGGGGSTNVAVARSSNQHPGNTPGRGIRFWRRRPTVTNQPAVPNSVKGYDSVATSTSVGSVTVTVPTRTVDNDLGIATHVYNPTTQETPDPTGWTLLDTQPISATAHARIYKKLMTAAEAGTALTFTNSTLQRLAAGIIVLDGSLYSDVDVIAGAIESVSRQNHTSPVTAVRTAAGLELNIYGVRSSTASTAITAPPGSALATFAFGVGSGATGVAIAVDPARTEAGIPAGGTDWNETTATASVALWTLAIAEGVAGAGGTTQAGDVSLTATAAVTATADVVRGADSALTAAAGIASSAGLVRTADAALSATATITAAGAKIQTIDAAVTATASITSDASAVRPGASTLTATAGIAPTGAVSRSAAVSLTVTVDRTPTAARIAGGDVAVSAVAAIAGTAAATHIADVSMTSTATITPTVGGASAAVLTATATIATDASVVHAADAAVTITASRTAVAARTAGVDASVSAVAAITGTAAATHIAGVSTTATATITADATTGTASAATLTATAGIAASASVVRGADASLTATGARTTTAARTAQADVTTTATASISPAGAAIRPANASLTITADRTVAIATAGDATLNATASISASVSVTRQADAALTATAIASAVMAHIAIASATRTATATVTTSAGRVVNASVAYVATASISAVAEAFPPYIPARHAHMSIRAVGNTATGRDVSNTAAARPAITQAAGRQVDNGASADAVGNSAQIRES